MLTIKIFEHSVDRIFVTLEDYKDFDPEKIGAFVLKSYPKLKGDNFIIDIFMADETPVSKFITSIFVQFQKDEKELH